MEKGSEQSLPFFCTESFHMNGVNTFWPQG
jgi:hypothetical protein